MLVFVAAAFAFVVVTFVVDGDAAVRVRRPSDTLGSPSTSPPSSVLAPVRGRVVRVLDLVVVADVLAPDDFFIEVSSLRRRGRPPPVVAAPTTASDDDANAAAFFFLGTGDVTPRSKR